MRNLKKKSGLLALLVLLCVPAARLQAQETIKVMTYNLLRYGAQGISCTPTGVTARNAWFSAIMSEAQPDIFGVNEVGPYAGPTAPATNILNNILKPINPAYAAANVTFNATQDVANAFFYNSEKLGLKSQAIIPHSLRNIDYYRLYYKGPGLATGDTTWIEVVLFHLHSSDASIRSSQTSAVMTYLGNLGRPGNFIIMGDMNMDGSGSGAFQNMVNSANANIDMADPISLTGTWTNNSNAKHAWSQSTRSGSGGADCGSGGGLNDRFDIILCSNAVINNSDDVRYIPGSYHVFGNPHAPNPAVGSAAQAGLSPMSDHYPVQLSLEISRAVAVQDPMPGFDLRLQNSPADAAIRFQLIPGAAQAGVWDIRLLDLQGRALRKTQVQLDAAGQALDFESSNLATGLYLLQACAPDGGCRTVRVPVQHR